MITSDDLTQSGIAGQGALVQTLPIRYFHCVAQGILKISQNFTEMPGNGQCIAQSIVNGL